MNSTSSTPIPSTTTTNPESMILEDSSSTWLIIILATALPLSLLLSGLIGLYFYKKYYNIRLAKPISRQSSQLTDSDHPEFEPIPIMEYGSEMETRLRSGTLSEEFNAINEFSSEINGLKSRTIGNDEMNKNKNRFIDIMPFDDNVVLLRNSPGGSLYSKYINASLIQGLSSKGRSYIATQGPKRNTVIDFWNMIVEYRVEIIVCLTNVAEDNRIKCFQYWPEAGESLNFDDLTVCTNRERANTSTGEVIVRDMSVFLGNNSEKKVHYVTQIHLTSWPDHGVPETTFPILETSRILRHIRRTLEAESFEPNVSAPVCVHCSAGVGRTGTFIGAHMTTESILDEGLRELDIFSMVKHLRKQRQKMVQSLSQYILIYEAVKDFINMKYQSGKNEEILSDYRAPSEETGYENKGYVE